MTKLKAAGIHLLISILIVSLALSTMYLLWYPGAYFSLMGGKKLIALIALVDIFLGPLLTFIVFKSGKKSLKFDLFCIGLIQIAALAYGVYVMFTARPVFTVFNQDRFQIAAVLDITPNELTKAKKQRWQQLSITGPIIVAIATPDKTNKEAVVFAEIEKQNLFRYPRLYDEYKNHLNTAIKAGKSIESLALVSAKNKSAVNEFLSLQNRPESDFLYLPITSELAEMSAILDAKSGDFLAIIDAKE
jgi:hypothetical protein